MSANEPLSIEDKIERANQIREIVSDHVALGAEFESISEGRKALASRIKSLGIPKKAFAHAAWLSEQDADKRSAYLNAEAELREALGLKLQGELDLQGGSGGPETEEDEEGDPLGKAAAA